MYIDWCHGATTTEVKLSFINNPEKLALDSRTINGTCVCPCLSDLPAHVMSHIPSVSQLSTI